MWGELQPPRRPRPKKEPTLRTLTATAPSPGSWLTPVGEPYRNPDQASQIIRDYQCQCGNPRTAVQSQVTYGTTTSCGCRAEKAKHRQHTEITPAETQAIRAWARENGLPVRENGRIPDQLVASHRLANAGYHDHLGSDGLLDQARVQVWATQNGHQLGVRNRVTGDLWLQYAAEIPSSDEH